MKISFFLLLIFPLQGVRGQLSETVVVGQVLDKLDRTPLASVSVSFKNTDKKIFTNEEGYFLIRNAGKETNLVFSHLGYKKKEINLKRGSNVGVEILLEEDVNYLLDVFVFPTGNPADKLMKKVQERRKENNLKFSQANKEQTAVFLSRKGSYETNRIFNSLKKSNLSVSDSLLLIPLYMEETDNLISASTKKQIKSNTFQTSFTTITAIKQLLKGLDSSINFYDNGVLLLEKGFISPLANIGSSYYRYYLTDSISTTGRKQYKVEFWSKNRKNLAFNGVMKIDSATLGLTEIYAELPRQANLNFVKNLHIQQKFSLENTTSRFIPSEENIHWLINYQLIKDSVSANPELLIKRHSAFSSTSIPITLKTDSFAATQYSEELMNRKLAALDSTLLFKAARFIADAVFTGYAKFGMMDVGKIGSVFRRTKPEGFNFTLPLRTNEEVSKNFMLGGFAGFGTRDKDWKYGVEFQYKLPFEKRMIVGVDYSKNYHWTDFDKNDYLWQEDPIGTVDENIISTLFGLKEGTNVSKRENYSLFFQNDWNDDIESIWKVENETFFAGEALPLLSQQQNFTSLSRRFVTLATRFSFGEKVINEHFQRIYLYNQKPVIYFIPEVGRFQLGENTGNYSKLIGQITQHGIFPLGEWYYFAEAGKIFGSVPYPMLKFFHGKKTGGYNLHQFSLLDYQEFPMDIYTSMHTELITNGVIFNYIPLIRQLNLREMFIFKTGYGAVTSDHTKWLNYPAGTSLMKKPYAEAGVGFVNLLRIFSLQAMWRLTDRDKPGLKNFAISGSLRIGF